MRAASAACLSTGTALAFHVAAGAPMPAGPGIVIPAVTAFAVAVALSGVALSRWRLALTVAAAQLAFHTMFGMGTAHAVDATTGAGSSHTHHVTSVAVSGASGHAGHGVGMTLAHLAAAVITYVLLRRADVLIGFASRLVAWLLRALLVADAPAIEPAPHTFAPPRPAQRPRLAMVANRSERGPPSLLA